MGITIDFAIKVLKRMIRKGRIAYDDKYAFESLSRNEEKACSFAIDIMNNYQQLQADYENRLKADLKAILVDLQLEIEECVDGAEGSPQFEQGVDIARAQVVEMIQQKINELRGK